MTVGSDSTGIHSALEAPTEGIAMRWVRSTTWVAAFFVLAGLGVIAARSTAGSWARWASAPTTTPGSARFLLTSR